LAVVVRVVVAAGWIVALKDWTGAGETSLVGGRVEVTKTGAVLGGSVFISIETHAVNTRERYQTVLFMA
jgi:hypothetical protein